MSKIGLAFLLTWMLAVFASAAQAQSQMTFTSAPGTAISDAAPVQNAVTVPAADTVVDLNVAVSITHSHGGDLRIRLTHAASGRSIILLRWLNGPGFAYGCGADAINATFDDAAAGPMDAFNCKDNFEMPVTGAWKPSQPLSTFNGISMAGVWTLEIVDALPTDNGVLNSWSLIFNTAPDVPPPPPPPGFDPTLTGEPPVPLCRDFDGSRKGTLIANIPNEGFGVYCRILVDQGVYIRNPGEIGIEAVINLGVIHAVDVYSPAGTDITGASICLKGAGRMIFLNAADAPRVPVNMQTVFTDGYTCAVIPYYGTLVLAGTLDSGGSSADQVQVVSTPLANCRVTTTHPVRLRTLPGLDSRMITMLPDQMTLTATARTAEWFRVIYLAGQGWVSAQYVEPRGDCGR